MPKIQKPLLAGNFDPTKAKFPYIASPKIDGIRFLMIDGVAVSRTFKPIRNKHIQSLLSQYLPDGVDGESINVTVSATEPVSASNGDIWVDTDEELFNVADDSVLWNGVSRPTFAGCGGRLMVLNSAASSLFF